MRRDLQLLAATATGPLVVGAVAVALMRGAAAPLPPESATHRATGRTIFRDLVVTGRAEGRTAWEVRAPRVATGPNRSQVDFEGGIDAVLLRGGGPRVRCRARSGTYASDEGTLRLFGPVTATIAPTPADQGDALTAAVGTLRLRTEALLWRTHDRHVDAPRPVEIDFERGNARVDRLQLDLDDRALDARGFQGRFLVREVDL
ncbi:MAG: LPS export ABC transporter periplasmic protein LptC [Armatimonadota bacterium]